MKNVLDATVDTTNPIYQKLITLKWLEYSICFLNGLAAFLFFMNCIFDLDSLGVYFFAGSGLVLFISQFQLLYIYFWRKNFKKYQHSTHGFESYSLVLRWSRIALLIWSLVLMVSAISIFISYPQFTEGFNFYILIMSIIEFDFFVLSLLYLYYNIQTKRLSNWK